MEFNDIFEVSREYYSSFVKEIKSECRDIVVEQIDKEHIAAKIYSKKTNKCLCARVACCNEEATEPEHYFIFEMPDNDERQAPTPTVKVVLNNKEEVQAFFDFIAKQREMEVKKNG